MIKIEYLIDCKGSRKFGTCLNCAKGSKDDVRMIRITIGYDRHSASFCLCEKCRWELSDKI